MEVISMKKTFIAVMIAALAIVANAEELALNMPFHAGRKSPIAGWDTDVENKDQVKVADGKLALPRKVRIFTCNMFACKAGDVFEIEVKATGSGRLLIGIGIWNSEGYVKDVAETVIIKAGENTFKVEIPVTDSAIRKASKARVSILAGSNSKDVIIENVIATLKPKE